jgi:hypothetical protein
VVEKERSSGMERSGVRHRCLLQISGHAGRAKREMGQRAARCRAEERKMGEGEGEGVPGRDGW